MSEPKKFDKEELNNYLQKYVNPLIKNLIWDLLDSKTTEVIPFIKKWCDSTGAELEANMPHNLDIDHLPDSISSKDSTMSFSTE